MRPSTSEKSVEPDLGDAQVLAVRTGGIWLAKVKVIMRDETHTWNLLMSHTYAVSPGATSSHGRQQDMRFADCLARWRLRSL